MDLSSIFFQFFQKKFDACGETRSPQASERERSRGRKEKVPCYLYAGTLLHSSVEDKTPGRCVRKGWLVYPAYPQHFFSLCGLVHICIPHTGTPCGRIIGNRSYWLSWVFPFVGLPFPHLLSLLYHKPFDLSIPFWKNFEAVVGVEPTFSNGERFQVSDTFVSQPFLWK